MTTFDDPHLSYLREHDLGVLATVAPNGAPQAKPVGYRLGPEDTTIDIAGFEMARSAKFRNIVERPEVAFTVEDRPDRSAGARGVRFVEVRGRAEPVRREAAAGEDTGDWIIRIHPRRVVSWNIADQGLFSADLTGAAADSADRPALELGGAAAERGRAGAQRIVGELQAGLDSADAERFNRSFADDVLWGSPYGATVEGYDTLHAIHRRLHAQGEASRSRYEIVRVRTPAPDVALAHVRRLALDSDGEPIPSRTGAERYSELALYVLVRRSGRWWLAAGQNAIVREDRGALTDESAR